MKVVVGIDGSDDCKRAVRKAVSLTHGGDDILLVVGIQDFPDFWFFPDGTISMKEEREKAIENGMEIAETFVKEAREIGALFGCDSALAKVQGTVVIGDPREEIIKVAQDEKAEMIIVGARGLGPIKRAILGSLSSYLVTHSPIDVLVCRAP